MPTARPVPCWADLDRRQPDASQLKAATLLGSALVAGARTSENRDTLKRQREDRDAEWKHKDEYAMPASAGLDFNVTPGEVGGMQDGVLTNGLLAGMSKQKKG